MGGHARLTLRAAADVVPADLGEFLRLPAGGVGAGAAVVCGQPAETFLKDTWTQQPGHARDGRAGPGGAAAPTWAVVLVDADRGRLQEAHSEALLEPEDQDLWLFVGDLSEGQKEPNEADDSERTAPGGRSLE